MTQRHSVTVTRWFGALGLTSSLVGLVNQSRTSARTPQLGATRLALQMLHDQEVDPVLVPHVVERADVRVVQAGDGLGFALEPLLQRRVSRDVARGGP